MSLQEQADTILPAVEIELRRQIGRLDQPGSEPFHHMLAYHMGWSTAGSSASGKRIRPLLLLLVVQAMGHEWLRAVSAAAAIELLHNFSLVHDDIEDNSDTRRGRQTLWKKHGIPMAINAGDALFGVANLAILDLRADYPADIVLRAANTLHAACLSLTRGQFLDMSYQDRLDLTVDDYWPMIEGKTAALLSATAQIGALLGGADEQLIGRYGDFGRNLGLAFQVQDDVLGIWGNEGETGKSVASDLVERKRSLPVLFGLAKGADFARRWAAASIRSSETAEVAEILRAEGAYAYSIEQAERLTNAAIQSLQLVGPKGAAGEALTELANKLLSRPS